MSSLLFSPLSPHVVNTAAYHDREPRSVGHTFVWNIHFSKCLAVFETPAVPLNIKIGDPGVPADILEMGDEGWGDVPY